MRYPHLLILPAAVLGTAFSTPAAATSPEDYVAHAPFKMAPIPVPTFPDRRFSITDFGAVGDGQTLNTGNFAQAIAACVKAGGGHVVVPAGLWLTGPIRLESNVDLHTERGAVIQFTSDHAAYPLVPRGRGFGTVSPLSGAHLKNVAVTGEGIFDGAGESWRPVKRYKMSDAQWRALLTKGGAVSGEGAGAIWWPTKEAMDGEDLLATLSRRPQPTTVAEALPARDFVRPILFTLSECENVLVEGVTLRNSPLFAFDPSHCTNLTVRQVNVFNEWWAQNGDGMDISACQNVLIYRCTLSVGDDAICMKSGGRPPAPDQAALQQVVIAECTVYRAHGGFVMGSETDGGMRNIWVTQCDFVDTDAGIYVKTGVGRGGLVRDIFVDHIYMKNIANEVILFDPYYVNRPASASKLAATPAIDASRVPEFTDFVFRDIYCLGGGTAIAMTGLPQQPVHRITIENTTITATRGFHATDAADITLKHVIIHTPEVPAVTEKNVRNIRIAD